MPPTVPRVAKRNAWTGACGVSSAQALRPSIGVLLSCNFGGGCMRRGGVSLLSVP